MRLENLFAKIKQFPHIKAELDEFRIVVSDKYGTGTDEVEISESAYIWIVQVKTGGRLVASFIIKESEVLSLIKYLKFP